MSAHAVLVSIGFNDLDIGIATGFGLFDEHTGLYHKTRSDVNHISNQYTITSYYNNIYCHYLFLSFSTFSPLNPSVFVSAPPIFPYPVTKSGICDVDMVDFYEKAGFSRAVGMIWRNYRFSGGVPLPPGYVSEASGGQGLEFKQEK
jgi:hypothetical protein